MDTSKMLRLGIGSIGGIGAANITSSLQTSAVVAAPEPVAAKPSRQVRRQEERTGLIGAVPTYYGGKPPYVARSKYMPHIGAKQRAKASK